MPFRGGSSSPCSIRGASREGVCGVRERLGWSSTRSGRHSDTNDLFDHQAGRRRWRRRLAAFDLPRTFASGRGVAEAAIAKRRRATHSNLKNPPTPLQHSCEIAELAVVEGRAQPKISGARSTQRPAAAAEYRGRQNPTPKKPHRRHSYAVRDAAPSAPALQLRPAPSRHPSAAAHLLGFRRKSLAPENGAVARSRCS